MQTDNRTKQALNNEHKGVLLEYCLANAFSKHSCNGLEQVSENFLCILKEYQNRLISDDLKTFSSLNKIAKLLTSYYLKREVGTLLSVELAEKEHSSLWGEADLKLNYSDKVKYISLKLIKCSSFVHTKSSGVHSLLSKYFKEDNLQKDFSKQVRLSFDRLQMSLLNEYDLAGAEGSFKDRLEMAGVSDRPGNLKGKDREYLYRFYEECIEILYSFFNNLLKNEHAKFIIGVRSLCGFSIDLEKLIFEYKDSLMMDYEYRISCENWSDYGIKTKDDIRLVKTIKSRSSFIISSPKVDIQLRLKPMNSFVTGGFKVNVSIRRKN